MDAERLRAKTAQAAEILEQTIGTPTLTHPMPPLDNLMLTILSQNTNDVNRDKAYQQLRTQFPAWEDVLNADVSAIADAIRSAGLSNQKSRRMQEILRWIKAQYGELSLHQLCEMTPQDAIDTFCRLNGVGIKTISVVLAFSCGVDIFPVDTHVHRLCNRIGLVHPPTNSPEKTFSQMQHRTPAGKAYSLHINLINHGRQICKARKPLCEQCHLTAICNFYQEQRGNLPQRTPRSQRNF